MALLPSVEEQSQNPGSPSWRFRSSWKSLVFSSPQPPLQTLLCSALLLPELPTTAQAEDTEENPDFHGASLGFPSLQWPLELLQSEHNKPQQLPATQNPAAS